jgi:hypothetical protein
VIVDNTLPSYQNDRYQIDRWFMVENNPQGVKEFPLQREQPEK